MSWVDGCLYMAISKPFGVRYRDGAKCNKTIISPTFQMSERPGYTIKNSIRWKWTGMTERISGMELNQNIVK